jgi:DNA repair exonuclease SbcCD ATPase subunit
MTPGEIILAVINAVVFCAVAFLLYRAYEKRFAEVRRRVDDMPVAVQPRFEKGLAEIRAQVAGLLQTTADDLNAKINERVRVAGEGAASFGALDARVGEFEKRLTFVLSGTEKTTRMAIDAFNQKIDAFQQRLDQLTHTFQDYQQNTRTWLEKTLESMERRWVRAASREPAEDMERIRRFKDEMPRFEEKFTDLAEKNREIATNLKRLSDQHKLLSDKLQEPASEEEQKECRRQITALMLNLGRVLGNSREILADGQDALRAFVGEMAPIFKVCDLCGEVHETLSICLNCGKKYCEICKGLQIGHCKDCAPYYKPLHIEVNE